MRSKVFTQRDERKFEQDKVQCILRSTVQSQLGYETHHNMLTRRTSTRMIMIRLRQITRCNGTYQKHFLPLSLGEAYLGQVEV